MNAAGFGNPDQLRVLLVADQVSSQFGGEAMNTLHYFRGLRHRGIDARLIAHDRTRQELLGIFPQDRDRIYFAPDSPLHQMLHRRVPLPEKVRHFTLAWMGRLLSQLSARRIARRLIGEYRVNVVHQPTPLSPKETSLLYDLGVPVVMGPLGA